MICAEQKRGRENDKDIIDDHLHSCGLLFGLFILASFLRDDGKKTDYR